VTAVGPDPYDVLGVSPVSSIDEIRLAYRRRMRALHPDGGGADDAAARREITAVVEAWRRLGSGPCGPSEPGFVDAPPWQHEAGIDEPEGATGAADGPAPRMLRPALVIAFVLLTAWLAVFVVIAISQSG
jgi:hypothetical protein